MIKSHSFMPRRPDVSEEEFHDHWLNVHGPLALRIDTLRRYVQSHRIPDAGGDTGYDGVAEVWFGDLVEGQLLRKHPAFVDSVEADELEFIDVPNMRHLLTTQELCDGDPAEAGESSVKLFMLFHRDPGSAPDELHRWTEIDETEAGRAVGAFRHARCVAIPEAYADGDAVWDGLRELWFDDLHAVLRAPDRDPGAWAALTAPPGADPSSTSTLVTREHRLIWPAVPKTRSDADE